MGRCGRLIRNILIFKQIQQFKSLFHYSEFKKGSQETWKPLIILYCITVSASDYSMIVATRPDPTVRPPSRL